MYGPLVVLKEPDVYVPDAVAIVADPDAITKDDVVLVMPVKLL